MLQTVIDKTQVFMKTFCKRSTNEMFLLTNELDVCTKLVFPGLLQYVDMKEDDRYINLFFTKPRGSKLLSERMDKLTRNQRFDIAITLLGTIQFMHSKGYVHMNISEHNVMLDISNSPKLFNFEKSEKNALLWKEDIFNLAVLFKKLFKDFPGVLTFVDECMLSTQIYIPNIIQFLKDDRETSRVRCYNFRL